MNSRKPDIVDAIRALCPEAQLDFSTNNNKITTWNSSDITQPTEDAINAKLTELNNEFPMKLLREERNRRIATSDWTQSRDITLSNDASWKTYRQALRDLPASSTPTLDSNGLLDMSSVTWPLKPST